MQPPHFDVQGSKRVDAGSNIYVGHIPSNYGDNDLRALFAPFGDIVSVRVMLNIHTGESRCIGFVKFEDPQSACRAIQEMHGKKAPTKQGGAAHPLKLVVRLSDGKAEYHPTAPTTKIFVRNVPIVVSEAELISHFSRFGPVIAMSTQPDDSAQLVAHGELPPMGLTHIIYITFDSAEAAAAAAAATHATLPFAACRIPLLSKVAEKFEQRVMRQHVLERSPLAPTPNPTTSFTNSSNKSSRSTPRLSISGIVSPTPSTPLLPTPSMSDRGETLGLSFVRRRSSQMPQQYDPFHQSASHVTSVSHLGQLSASDFLLSSDQYPTILIAGAPPRSPPVPVLTTPAQQPVSTAQVVYAPPTVMRPVAAPPLHVFRPPPHHLPPQQLAQFPVFSSASIAAPADAELWSHAVPGSFVTLIPSQLDALQSRPPGVPVTPHPAAGDPRRMSAAAPATQQ